MTRILIVDDHPVMRRGIASLIEGESDLTICGETGSAVEARRLVRETSPDFVIVDLSLEEGSGLSLIKDVRAAHPDLPMLVVSMHDEDLYAHRALEAGAQGYVMKSEADTQVVEAIRQVLREGIYLSSDLTAVLLLHYVHGAPDQDSPLQRLSDRELEVLLLTGRGHARSKIAAELQLSPKTVDTYRDHLKEKLSIDTNAQLRRCAAIWVELGYLPEDKERDSLP